MTTQPRHPQTPPSPAVLLRATLLVGGLFGAVILLAVFPFALMVGESPAALYAPLVPLFGVGAIGVVEHVLPADRDAARIRCSQADGALDGGGLPRAVGAKQAEDLPLADGDAHPAERFDLVVAFGQVLDLKLRRHLMQHPHRRRVRIKRTATRLT